MDSILELDHFKKNHPYFVAIDSDGCVFDTMEIKHKQCFLPSLLDLYGLHSWENTVSEVWNFINLYSRNRGINRFKGLSLCLQELQQREYEMDTAELRNTEALFDWTAKESKLSMSSLKAVIEKSPHEDLRLAYRWSEESSRKISRSIQGLEPFDHVKSCLARIHERCDSLVSSSSTQSSLQEEWGNNGLSPLVQCIAGQEWGSKKEHLQRASQSRYSSEKMLMIGDAPGDFKAAQSLGALFFPILPGREEESWLELKVHGLDRFFDGEFAGEYQESRLEEFFSLLPEKATWQGVC